MITRILDWLRPSRRTIKELQIELAGEQLTLAITRHRLQRVEAERDQLALYVARVQMQRLISQAASDN